MKRGSLDSLVMLLSTDWFLPYWFTLGIGMETEKKSLIQTNCREIVKQIMSGATEYWQTNFSDERVDKTNAMFQDVLQKCSVDKAVTDKINGLIRGEKPPVDEVTGWLVVSITEQLVHKTLGADHRLDPRITDAIVRTWDMTSRMEPVEATELERLCLSSKSAWDVLIRNTTPDLPTKSADYASAVASKDKFQRFWAAISTNLAPNERSELLKWYRAVGESMTGEPLRLSF